MILSSPPAGPAALRAMPHLPGQRRGAGLAAGEDVCEERRRDLPPDGVSPAGHPPAGGSVCCGDHAQLPLRAPPLQGGSKTQIRLEGDRGGQTRTLITSLLSSSPSCCILTSATICKSTLKPESCCWVEMGSWLRCVHIHHVVFRACWRSLPGFTGCCLTPCPQSSLGFEGTEELMKRALEQTTYSSLCLPDDIADRGLQNVPDFYYRDDGLKVWNAING